MGERQNALTGHWSLKLFGSILLLLGLVLLGGGVWLLALGGSPYYALAGIALIVAGIMTIIGRLSGFLVLLGFLTVTVIWSMWESEGSNWALVPRLVVPLILALIGFLLLPIMKQRKFGWGSASIGAVSLFGLTALILLFYGQPQGIRATAGQINPMTSRAMHDPSLSKVGTDWPAYGGSYAARRHSPLQQITPDNVERLAPAWVYATGDLPKGDPSKSKYGAETTPLKVGDSLYLCSAMNILIALDPASGEEKWRFDPGVNEESIPYTAACRGVVYFQRPAQSERPKPSEPATAQVAQESITNTLIPKPGDDCDERIIEGTLDGRLVAVNARTGKPCAAFGNAGEVDITIGMGKKDPGMVSMTSAPTIVQGVIVTGHQVKDGVRLDAPSGVLQGFDAVSGEHLWAWDMDQPEREGPLRDGEVYTRGTPNMWTTASGDEELGLVYLPMGNSAGDYLSSERSEAEDKYSTSLIAIDVHTGKPVWHFQTVYIDVWDYDLGSQATLIDYQTSGGPVPALVLPSKQGDIYILNRRTGEPLTPVIERSVPGGGVEPGERTAKQPFSGYHTLAKEPLKERDMWGISPVDQLICRINFRRAEYQGMYTPPTTKTHWIQYPGYNGGSDWGGISVDPTRGVIIANYNDMPNYNILVPRQEADKRLAKEGVGSHAALAPQEGAPYAIDVNAGWRMPFTGVLCKEPPYGGIRAIDLQSGETLWDRPYGTARNNGPFNIPSRLPFVIGTPNNGGAVTTASGLIFIAAATDDLFKAIDTTTGETLWQDVLPGGGQATPITYEHEGRQFVVIMAGGHHFMETKVGDKLVAYVIPQE